MRGVRTKTIKPVAAVQAIPVFMELEGCLESTRVS